MTKVVDRTSTTCHLALQGPARLDVHGHTVRLQRKSLAMLYVLALEGPTRRERMADLLWGHGQALRNLRVELHGLRQVLRDNGIEAFERGQDPLTLPAGIVVDRTGRSGEALEGLEDLSRQFQSWLEDQRSRLDVLDRPQPVFTDVVADLAADVRVPHVLVLEGLPFAGRRDLARALAGRMDLPYREGVEAGGRGLRYVDESTPFSNALVDRIVEDRRGLWVIERPAFGEDPFLVLALRERYPAGRLRYLHVGSLGWQELRTHRLAELPFEEAAQMYLASGGLLGYVDELVEIRPEGGFGGFVPVPRRVKAGFQMEARRLSMESRFALGRLAIHPGTIPEPLLDTLNVTDHLSELERRRWLRYDGRWAFVHDVARALAYEDAQPGQRALAHRSAAAALETAGQAGPARYHDWCARGRDRTDDPFASSRTPFDPPRRRVRTVGPFRALDPVATVGDAEWIEDRLWMPAADSGVRLGRIAFDLPPGPQLLRIHGAIARSGPVVSSGRPTAIELTQGRPGAPAIRIVSADQDGVTSDGAWELGRSGTVDLRFWVSGGVRVSLGTHTSGIVATLAIEAAPARAVDADHGEDAAAEPGENAREASVVDASEVVTTAIAWTSAEDGAAIPPGRLPHDRHRARGST